MTLPSAFNRILLDLNRLNASPEEKALLLHTVARSTQAATLYLYFLEYWGEVVDPQEAGLPESTTMRLVKLFEFRGLIERAGRRRGESEFLHITWRLT